MKKWTIVLSLATILSLLVPLSNVQETSATIMPYPATIEALAKSSDLVAKVKILSIDPGTVENAALKNDFWKVRRAHFQLISAVKGNHEVAISDLIFRSSDPHSKTPQMWINVGPENYPHYNLKTGHCYIIFMKRSSSHDYLEQTSSQFGLRSWEGFFQCRDDEPIKSGKNASEAVWNELTKALHSKDQREQKESVLTLLNLSSSDNNGTIGSADFDRTKVVAAILSGDNASAAGCHDDASLKELIQAMGSDSPYSNEWTRMRYLWSKASNPISSWSEWKCTNRLANTAAITFLIKIADGKHQPSIRAEAILTMGGCHSAAQSQQLLTLKLRDWLKSPEPEIRAAAAILSTDYPKSVTTVQITNMLQDKAPSVRRAAAYSVGITHTTEAIANLEKMLHDPNQETQAAAALSLMAYPVDKVKGVLTANLSIPAFSSAFLARLALTDPASVRDKLLGECQRYKPLTQPNDMALMNIPFQNGLGTSPQGLCVLAMTNYLNGLSSDELRKPNYKVYLESIENIGAVDPSQTGKVYEILICHRLTDRAAAFRKRAQVLQPSLPAIAFEQPDRELKAGSLKYK